MWGPGLLQSGCGTPFVGLGCNPDTKHWSDWWVATKKTISPCGTTRERTSVAEDFKVQVSIKDYDGDMVNFRAASLDELKAELAGFPMEEYVAAKANIRAASAVQPVVNTSTSEAPAPAPAAAPQGQVKTCAHGVRQFKTGQGRTGVWQAYFCPLPKNTPGACEPEWVR
jgi:hypothetical protein